MGLILSSTVALLLGLLLQSLLDFRIAIYFVKYFYRIPTRMIFKHKFPDLSGTWEQIWQVNSSNFPKDTDRHSHATIGQLGPYCYAEHISKGKTYIIFGRIKNSHIIGEWFDYNDYSGYFGTFQLHIVNSETMNGKWIGYSKTTIDIRSGAWDWKRI